MKALYCIPLLALSMAVQAAPVDLFSGVFDVSKWAITLQAGTVDTSLAPASVRFVTADDGSGPSEQKMTIAAPSEGTVSFNWNYTTADSAPVWDAFSFLLNGSFIPVSDDLADVAQIGSFSYTLQAGDVFGFSALSFDSSNGASTTTVSTFRFNPVAVPPPPPGLPEPGTWSMVLLALAGVAACRRPATQAHKSTEQA